MSKANAVPTYTMDILTFAQEYCNDYTNPNWTIYGEAIKICAGPYETEVPLTDPDHNFAGTSYEVTLRCQVTEKKYDANSPIFRFADLSEVAAKS